MESGSKWYVIYVRSRQEKKVAKSLTDFGVECYLPVVRKLQQWADRKKWVDFPMFAGYLFVRPTVEQQEGVLRTNGVVGFLRLQGELAVVRQSEIDIIRTIEDQGYFAETILTAEDFSEGERVLVNEGPLKGVHGEIVRKNNEQFFLLSFDSIGQSLKVTLPVDVLKKVREETF